MNVYPSRGFLDALLARSPFGGGAGAVMAWHVGRQPDEQPGSRDIPVSIAETVHIDPAVDLEAGTHCTAAAATSVILGNGPVEVVENGTIHTYEQAIRGIELGAYIVTQGTAVPAETVPFPSHERSVHALDHGDLGAVFDADVELLQRIASQLTYDPDDTDFVTSIPSLLSSERLRQELTIEGDRLRHAAARLQTLRGKVLAQLTHAGRAVLRT